MKTTVTEIKATIQYVEFFADDHDSWNHVNNRCDNSLKIGATILIKHLAGGGLEDVADLIGLRINDEIFYGARPEMCQWADRRKFNIHLIPRVDSALCLWLDV